MYRYTFKYMPLDGYEPRYRSFNSRRVPLPTLFEKLPANEWARCVKIEKLTLKEVKELARTS